MRLRRLALSRYGMFTDRTIDFGEAIEGEPDLHLVYGPNEAGKSTAFAGFLDLLFGIELQSRYGFLHPYETMRVGGCLELSVGSRELMRIKKPQPTLRDANNQPVAESLILGDLGGLDRNAYRTMFSLDDETLEAGGNSILASNGELGLLLFSASAGLAELSKTLVDLRLKTDGFTWPNARSGELHQLKAGLATLKQARDAIDTLASEYNRLAAERDGAASRYEAALVEQSRAQADLARIRRMLAALPRVALLRRLREKLAPFADLPEVPLSWLTELPSLEQADSRHRLGAELAVAEVKRLSIALAAVTVDAGALRLADGLERLNQLAARNLTAELDLPKRDLELARADGEIGSILMRLGRAEEAEPGRLQLTAAQSASFEELLATRSGIEAKVIAASDELSQALLGLTEAQHTLNGEATGQSPATIVSALQALRESDHLLRLRNGIKSKLQFDESFGMRMAALVPWCGNAEELAALTLPDPTTVEAWQEEAQQHAAVLARRRDDIKRLEGELDGRSAELDAIGSVAGLLSDQQAAEVRGAREAAWSEHRRALELTTADVFEAALRRDDIVSGARLKYERDLAKLHETAQAVAIKRAEVKRARASLAEAVAGQEAHAALVAEAATRIGAALADFSPMRLLAWMGKRDDALECWHQLGHAELEVNEAEATASALRNRLLQSLIQGDVPADPLAATDALVAAAQVAVDRGTRVQALRQNVADCEREVRKRELAIQKASLADKAWRAAWHAACSGCWLGEAAAALPFGVVRGVLAAAAELGPLLKERSSLEVRIRAMRDDQTAFGHELARLTADLGIDPSGRSSSDSKKAVSDRVQEACRANDERQRLENALAGARDTERDCQEAARVHASRVSEMTEALQVTSLIEVAGKLRDTHEKADLKKQAVEAERDLLTALHVGSLAEALTLLDGQSEPELEVEQARLSVQLEGLEGRTRELFAANKEALDRIAAVGGDDAAARIEERRRTQLLDIEEKAGHYLRVRLGIAAADRALRAYRDKHRSSMMKQASEAFRLISRGAYRGLGTQPGKDGDILVALGAEGGSKLAADLSKGTRFQLYLALRAAGYQEFAKIRPPVPFIADDIMETFDDFRAEETLKMLGEMSRLGQVIYLTHHDHLRAIAKRTIPSVRIHALGDDGAGSSPDVDSQSGDATLTG
jgi:uncharacterized protein YhaN